MEEKNSEQVYMEILKDILTDMDRQRRFLKTLVMVVLGIMFILAICMACGMIMLSLHNQQTLQEMSDSCNERIATILDNFEMYTEYEIYTDDYSLNNGGINVQK